MTEGRCSRCHRVARFFAFEPIHSRAGSMAACSLQCIEAKDQNPFRNLVKMGLLQGWLTR